MRKFFVVVFLLELFCVVAVAEDKATPANTITNQRPIFAIWRDREGRRNSEAPYLRIAIWNDGRVIFAGETNRWNHQLREGRIEQKTLERLKKDLAATGVFELKGNCYLVPDAPVDCVMLALEGREQMLYWDEVEKPGYGINIAPKPQHLEFKECWKRINQLALAAIPKESKPIAERFVSSPKSWRLKPPIQSE